MKVGGGNELIRGSSGLWEAAAKRDGVIFSGRGSGGGVEGVKGGSKVMFGDGRLGQAEADGESK